MKIQINRLKGTQVVKRSMLTDVLYLLAIGVDIERIQCPMILVQEVWSEEDAEKVIADINRKLKEFKHGDKELGGNFPPAEVDEWLLIK